MSIIRFGAIAAAAVIAASAFGSGSADAKGKCVLAGGQGQAIGDTFAKEVAKAALTESLTKSGMKGTGKVSYKCTTATGFTTCNATQRACK